MTACRLMLDVCCGCFDDGLHAVWGVGGRQVGEGDETQGPARGCTRGRRAEGAGEESAAGRHAGRQAGEGERSD